MVCDVTVHCNLLSTMWCGECGDRREHVTRGPGEEDTELRMRMSGGGRGLTSASAKLVPYCHWRDSSEVRVQKCMVALTVLTAVARRLERLGSDTKGFNRKPRDLFQKSASCRATVH